MLPSKMFAVSNPCVARQSQFQRMVPHPKAYSAVFLFPLQNASCSTHYGLCFGIKRIWPLQMKTTFHKHLLENLATDFPRAIEIH